MGLMDEVLTTQAKKRTGPRCSIAGVLTQLSKKDADELREVLARDDVMHTTIEEVLRGRGLPIEGKTIARHRKGKCSCGAA